MCTVLLPPGDNPIAVNKYIDIKYSNKEVLLQIEKFRKILHFVKLLKPAGYFMYHQV